MKYAIALLARTAVTVFALATLPLHAEQAPADGHAVATFAGGCFWCMEPPYDELEGVISTTSGYTDGHTENPTYKQVTSGRTGHTEAVQVVYDPAKVSFEKLVEVFWRNIDPTDIKGQFCDRGSQYRPTLFYHDAAQREIAERSRTALERSKPFDAEINTPIVAASTFYAAEEYHQDYYVKNPIRYKYYRNGCGRDRRLEQLWGASR
ncbi:peptide-methionine (S)-S-oxide reductase MsrA [Pseudazoarcus pumilus]|uniref:Peptide methionine sulfoxide reductase MsrA n=1 Tax=Pseudazoarcus pumilus TaxID=2067960 RepID=A0A2I6S5G2_9RHOO|nr:peptide-methionine (S)-S-oxide reductase MsrA [Pseudazoarcus pumilus]AUN94490.1 peptide-methionine (S)-S-oxide reductase [Pseudazoarcus pumilus]